MLITENFLEGPGYPIIKIDGTSLICPACSKIVYPDVVVLKHHHIKNWGQAARWFSLDMDMVVHECGCRVAEADEVASAFDQVLARRTPLFERLRLSDVISGAGLEEIQLPIW